MKPEFIIERQGKQMVLYAGLLDYAHSLGLVTIETELLQVPNEANGGVCICHASAEFRGADKELKSFDGIGDACASNVGPHIRPHLIRMAETRAKARALRDGTNIAMVSVEELGDDDTKTVAGEALNAECESLIKLLADSHGDVAKFQAWADKKYRGHDFWKMTPAQRVEVGAILLAKCAEYNANVDQAQEEAANA